jgi:thermitase
MNIKQFNKVIVILTLVVGVLSAADAEQVPGRFLVGVRDAATASRTLAVHNAKVRRDFRGLSAIAIEVSPQSDGAVLESLRQSGSFEYVEPDYYAHTAADPNDPSYASQWHLRRIGGPLAWSLSTGSDSVVVAIVDSGVYPHHPDLASKLVPGWNFVKDNADTADVLGHGTAVAGTVAAQTNNGLGVAGVTWAGRIMPLVAVDAQDYAAYSDIAAAIQYAADHGVRVINVSIGGFNSSITLQKAVDYAWSKGALVFASAMNEGISARYYPAACAHAVAVGATDANDRLASFSNYGSWITLAAPGTGILSTADGGGYSFWNGTSFASPIAAGVAALVLSVNPQLTNEEVLSILKNTAERAATEPDAYIGWGRVNAYRAVLAAEPQKRSPRPLVPIHIDKESPLH